MSDVPVVDVPVAEPVAVDVPQVSPVEVSAREQGWVGKEEWVESGRAEDEWRPAKEFIDRGELYKSIHSTKRELKQTQAALDALQTHHKMVYEKAYQTALNDLKLQKRQAIREGDLEALEIVEEKMDGLKEEHVKDVQQLQTAQRAQVGPPPEFQSFLDRNPWYASDKGLQNEADALGFIYLKNGGAPAEMLPYVEKEMRKKFPEKFGVKRAAPNAVVPSTRSGPTRKESDGNLTDAEREIMTTFVRSGVMTKEQYINDLKKIKERN